MTSVPLPPPQPFPLLATSAHVSSREGTCGLCGGLYSYGARVALVEGHGVCHLVPCVVELAS
jgi:hypothetical protein